MDGWQETACTTNGTGNKHAPASLEHVFYDPHEELVWTGDSAGRLSSFWGPLLRPYTAFRAHNGPVLDLQVASQLVWSLSDDGVRCHKRSGLLKAHAPHMKGIRLLVSDNEILVASERRVNRYNLDTFRETGTFALDAPEGVTILFLRKSPPNICLGLSDGTVQIVDSNTFDTLQAVKSHTGSLTDLDCRKNMVMTCGLSLRRYGPVQDQIVHVYDTKAAKSLPLLPIADGAAFVRMHPRSPTNCTVASNNGQIHFSVDMKKPGLMTIQQMALTSRLAGMDVSPQGDSVVFIEDNGWIHHWSRNLPGDPTAIPQSLDLPASMQALPHIGPTTPLSAVGMPYYKSELLSSWSLPLQLEVGMPPVRDLVQAKRNVASKYVSVLKLNRRSSVSIPRFLSERERQGPDGDLSDNLFEKDDSIAHGKVPRVYRQQQIHYSRFGVDDFNFQYYNKSRFSGLENQVPGNTYCNSLLQLLRWCAPVHNWALHKFAAYNYQPLPFLGELAVLFDMLHKGRGRQCRAANFLNMLGANPEAITQGLLDVNRSASEKLTELHSFLIRGLMNEEIQYTNGETELRDIVGTTLTSRMYGTCGYRADIVEPHVNIEATAADHKGLSAALSRSNDSWLWCEKCQKHHSMAVVRQTTAMSPVLFVTVVKPAHSATLAGKATPAPANKWSLVARADKRSYKVVDSETPDYELAGYVAEVTNGQQRHLIAIINVGGQWHLFNDFLIKPIEETEAFDFSQTWKRPVLLMYQRKDCARDFDYTDWRAKVDTRLLYERNIESGNAGGTCRAKVLTEHEIKPGYLAALDAEFVLLGQEVAEIHSDGTKSLVQPRTMSLARVSVIRGSPPAEEEPFIDDFIETRRPILDYVTQYSGIEQGDLDPVTSPYALVTQSTATKRLWILLNKGVVFIGHALINDFRTINLQIPPEQIIDTSELYHDKKGPRKLSLKFLVWAVLGEQIQTGNHDSIEDALSALRLYRKYQKLVASGTLDSEIEKVYALGQSYGYKVPNAPP